MNADSYGPRLSPAESLLERPKRNQKAADTHGFGLPFIHPGLLVCLRPPWPSDWQSGLAFRWRP